MANNEREKLFPWVRVLMEFDKNYQVYVARCLETGSVATADDFETLKDIMTELLEDEFAFAYENDNMGNLFSSPAPMEVFERWLKVAEKGGVEIIDLNVRVEKESKDDRKDIAGVRVARAA